MRLFFLLFALANMADREAIRFSHCSEQEFDTSCGLAALSCLMERYWGEPCGELQLAAEFFPERIARSVFFISFADMARILESKGFACRSYRMTYGQLVRALETRAPIIVHYDRPAGHFALALEADGDWIAVSDPAWGDLALDRASFEARWSGKALVAAAPARTMNEAFLKRAVDSVRGRKRVLDGAARRMVR